MKEASTDARVQKYRDLLSREIAYSKRLRIENESLRNRVEEMTTLLLHAVSTPDCDQDETSDECDNSNNMNRTSFGSTTKPSHKAQPIQRPQQHSSSVSSRGWLGTPPPMSPNRGMISSPELLLDDSIDTIADIGSPIVVTTPPGTAAATTRSLH